MQPADFDRTMRAGMKRRSRLYLETSFWSRLAERVYLARRRASYRFLNSSCRGQTLLISALVVEEVEDSRDVGARRVMMRQIRRIRPKLVGGRSRAVTAARRIMEEAGFGERMLADLTHVAYAVFGRADAVVTWNMRTLARSKVRLAVHAYCRKHDRKAPLIGSPEEVAR